MYANKLDNLEEMDKFLETYIFPKMNQKELENLNTQIKTNEVKPVIIILKTHKKQISWTRWL